MVACPTLAPVTEAVDPLVIVALYECDIALKQPDIALVWGTCASKLSVSDTRISLHTLQTGDVSWKRARLRILCVTHSVETREIQAIAGFKSGRPHQPTHTHKNRASHKGSNRNARTRDSTHSVSSCDRRDLNRRSSSFSFDLFASVGLVVRMLKHLSEVS